MPLCVTFVLCFWEVQYGIVAGILVSGILLLYTIARPPIEVRFRPPAASGGLFRLCRSLPPERWLDALRCL